MPKYVLDTNCYIDATSDLAERQALERFVAWASPFLHLSTVVAAELRAGARTPRDRRTLERLVLDPFVRRGRVVAPGPEAWDALGLTLATLSRREGVQPELVGRAFAFDVLLAFSAREIGATVVTRNARDMARIRRVFTFAYVAPYPVQPERAP